MWWNEAFCASLGISPSDVDSVDKFFELVHPEDRALLEDEGQRVLAMLRPYAMRYRLVTPQGTTKELLAWGELDGSDSENETVRGGLFDVTTEVSERVRLEEDLDRLAVAVQEAAAQNELLAKSERRFRLVFENAPIGMAMLTTEGRYLAVNRAFAEIAGRRMDELIGMSVVDLAHERHRSESTTNLAQLLEGEVDSLSIEREIVRPDGATRWTSIKTVVERSAEGVPAYYVSMVEDVTDRRDHARELERQALRDTVTGLPNRSCLRDRLGHDLQVAARTGVPVGVLFCDLDRFKSINDRFGHGVADEVLLAVARRLTGAVRAEDTVARYAGDEFVVACLQGTPDALTELAERISSLFREPVVTSVGMVDCGISIGVAVADRGQGVDALLDEADEAMYEAKRRGRGRVEFFDEDLENRRLTRVRTQAGLRNALEADELVVHYQPQVSLVTGEVVGVEALLRWRHPSRGLLDAKEFIGVAEEAGLLAELSITALGKACAQGAAWGVGSPGALVPHVAVNVAASQVGRADLSAIVASAVSESGIAPAGLHLEVTEEGFIDDLDAAAASLEALADVGVLAGIDDFGTGYASLAHLHTLPVRFLKLDGTFVSGLDDRKRAALASSVVDLARNFDLAVVAECVETEWQASALRRLGVDSGQGYLWAPALPADELEHWLVCRSSGPEKAASL